MQKLKIKAVKPVTAHSQHKSTFAHIDVEADEGSREPPLHPLEVRIESFPNFSAGKHDSAGLQDPSEDPLKVAKQRNIIMKNGKFSLKSPIKI